MITINEIARLCGVSRATVSAVLNNKPGVSERMKSRVLEFARQSDFHPRLMARSMVAQFSRMVGVMVRDINNLFFLEVQKGMGETLAARGYHMLYQGSDAPLEDSVETFRVLRTSKLAGYAFSAIHAGPALVEIRKLLEEGRPVVSIGGSLDATPCHVVSIDFRKGGRLAADYLIHMGHRKICCLAGPPIWGDERVFGFVQALLDHQVPFHENMVVRAGASSQEGYEIALKVLADPVSRPTAFICYNDMIALGVYRAAHELRLRIPDDLSVVGFDGIEIGEVIGPPLTTVATYPRLLGEWAADILVRAIEGELGAGMITRITEPELIERESVRPV